MNPLAPDSPAHDPLDSTVMADPVDDGAGFDPLAQPWQRADAVRITGVRAVVTAPEGIPLVMVRVDTNQPGLYGWGCATFTQRWPVVVRFVETALAPLVVGRDAGDIADLDRLVRYAGYWREGPVINNALSGLDMALWDILGKQTGQPVYALIGGRVRAAADTYLHAGGVDLAATLGEAEALVDAGQRHVRLQVAQPGVGRYGTPLARAITDPTAPYPAGWEPGRYLTNTVELFRAARAELGPQLELLHDVHSRLRPAEAIWLGRAVEEFRPFFLEDVLAPEWWGELPRVRAAVGVPLAVGELATSLPEAGRLISGGGVDFIRCHVSGVGGFTAARKLAVLAEFFGARTAWHNPGDLSPVGAAANATLDVCSTAFGIQEGHVFNAAAEAVFPGCPRIERGWIRPSDEPGWGVDVDEREAAAFPPPEPGRAGDHDRWAAGVRGLDGGLFAP